MKVIKDELIAMKNSNIITTLYQDASDAKELSHTINDFVNNSSKYLTDPIYNELREQFAKYIPVLQNRANSSEMMANAIKSGCLNLIWYMGNSKTLDEETKTKYHYQLNEMNKELKNYYYKDFNKENSSLINYWDTYFTYQNTANEYKKNIEKLDDLKKVDLNAFSPIKQAYDVFINEE